MKKTDFYDIREKITIQISSSMGKSVYKLKNGEYFKMFDPNVLAILKSGEYDIESHIMSARKIPNAPEIIIPSSGVYLENSRFLGYTTPPAKGISYGEYEQNLSLKQRADLYNYANLYSSIENAVKKAEDIVFPDLCTIDNMFMNWEKGKRIIQFIDYEGIQIGDFKPICVSSSLGEQSEYQIPKYWTGLQYTKELDKKSLIILYFLTTFNMDLTKVGSRNPLTGKLITLDDIFKFINLSENDDICQKAWKLFQQDIPNEYLGDSVFNLAEKYSMIVGTIDRDHGRTGYIKQMTRK